jgi:hypothetical protein
MTIRRRPRLVGLMGLVLASSLVAAMPAEVFALSKPGCLGYHYTGITRSPDSLKVLSGPYSYINTTNNNQTFSLSRTVSGTVALTVSVSVSATAEFFVGKVEASTGMDVSTSVTISETLTGNMVVDPHSVGYLSFGINRVVTKGHLVYDDGLCHVLHDYGTVTVWSPAYEGFIARESPL